MLALEFQLAGELYAIEASNVIEALPALPLTAAPLAARGIAGSLNYHGTAVPVIDLQQMLGGATSTRALNSRILICAKPGASPLGLLLPGGARLRRLGTDELKPSPVEVPEANFLGSTYHSEARFGRLIKFDELLTEQVRQQLKMTP